MKTAICKISTVSAASFFGSQAVVQFSKFVARSSYLLKVVQLFGLIRDCLKISTLPFGSGAPPRHLPVTGGPVRRAGAAGHGSGVGAARSSGPRARARPRSHR